MCEKKKVKTVTLRDQPGGSLQWLNEKTSLQNDTLKFFETIFIAQFQSKAHKNIYIDDVEAQSPFWWALKCLCHKFVTIRSFDDDFGCGNWI